MSRGARVAGYTLLELLAVLLVLALTATIAYRGLDTVLTTRAQAQHDAARWRDLSAFFMRFEQDVSLAIARPARAGARSLPPWNGVLATDGRPQLAFTRLGRAAEQEAPLRIAYVHTANDEIRIAVATALDQLDASAQDDAVLAGVARFDLAYLDAHQRWVTEWSAGPGESALPIAVRVTVTFDSGLAAMRVFRVAG